MPCLEKIEASVSPDFMVTLSQSEGSMLATASVISCWSEISGAGSGSE